MFFWSLNYLFLLCSILLLVLGGLLIFSRRNHLTWPFFIATTGLSCWNFCVFAIDEQWAASQVSWVARIQLWAILIFGNGIFFFCSSFPHYRRNGWHKVSGLLFLAFTVLLLFTKSVTDAEVIDGRVSFQDGPGFAFYVAYIFLLAGMVFYYLGIAWKSYPELRSKTRYFIAGITLFIFIGCTFNLIFPLLENYSFLVVGRLSGTVMALLFFYAIAKHEFLDITIIINRYVAWLVTLLLLVAIAVLVQELIETQESWASLSPIIIAVVSAVLARPLQQFLLTTAKRKFIKGWYEPEQVFLQLGSVITQETNREKIFRKVLDALDSVFEVEQALAFVAERNIAKELTGYKELESFSIQDVTSPFILYCRDKYQSSVLSHVPLPAVQDVMRLQPKLNGKAVIIPFHSPEFLEGILVLGARSSGADYSVADMVFFNSLINYMEPLLYRLTPIETLEKLYNENQRRLHQAELQLVRAQKIEAIAHATRQCHHEIRTPLNIIKLGIGRIKTLEDLENYKAVAHEEINHAIEIVDETLAITDMNASTPRAQGDVQINEVISRCLRLVDSGRYRLSQHLQEIPVIKGIASDLQVAITNLIHNAMEAMPNGGALSVTTVKEGDNIVIRVNDTGAGIPDEIRARVWEPYFSGRGEAIGNSTAGRGWGLTIVNRIISAHGGSIQFTSEVGVGTHFAIRLPIR